MEKRSAVALPASPSARLRLVLALLAALPFLVLPVRSLIEEGPFDWHVRQPEAWQGGVESVLLFLLFALAALTRTRAASAAALIAAALYARRHGIDLSLAVTWLYAEAILAVGWRLLPWFGLAERNKPERFLVAGLLGVIGWSLVLWTLSALGAARAEVYQFTAVALLGCALLTRRNATLAALSFHVLRRARGWNAVFLAFMASFFLVLFAKAAVVVDYDSLWYGLQGEEVLIGDGGLFAAQGLVAVVHYYPKLYEVLLLPFSGLGSISLLFGSGIFSALLVAMTSAAILRELGVGRALRSAGAALVMTLPALANIAVSAKGDAFSAWLLLLGLFALLRLQKTQAPAWFWISGCCAVLAVMSRLSNIPYAALLVLMLGFVVVREGHWRRLLGGRGKWIGAAGIVLVCFVTLRTYAVAGVPLIAPNALVGIEQALGFRLRYPIGLLPGGAHLPDFPVLRGLGAFLFDPATLPHVIITWTGNVWAWLPLAALLLGWRSNQARGWPLLAVGASFFAVLFAYRHPVPGGDGNYFITPIVCLVLWGLTQLSRVDAAPRTTPLLLGFCVCSAAIAFVTGSWGPGTRGFDRDLTRLPMELDTRARQGIDQAKLSGVNAFFAVSAPGTRVVGLGLADLASGVPPQWWLPVRYEPLEAFAWQQPLLVQSPAALQEYLRRSGIDYVVVPNAAVGSAVEPVVRRALLEMKAAASADVAHEDGVYTVWKLVRSTAVSIPLEGGGTARLIAPDAELCAGSTNAVATVAWQSDAPAIAVEVRGPGAADASLWAEGSGSGRQMTGPWVSKGAEFTFRNGRGGDVLGVLRVEPDCD